MTVCPPRVTDRTPLAMAALRLSMSAWVTAMICPICEMIGIIGEVARKGPAARFRKKEGLSFYRKSLKGDADGNVFRGRGRWCLSRTGCSAACALLFHFTIESAVWCAPPGSPRGQTAGLIVPVSPGCHVITSRGLPHQYVRCCYCRDRIAYSHASGDHPFATAEAARCAGEMLKTDPAHMKQCLRTTITRFSHESQFGEALTLARWATFKPQLSLLRNKGQVFFNTAPRNGGVVGAGGAEHALLLHAEPRSRCFPAQHADLHAPRSRYSCPAGRAMGARRSSP